MIKAYRYFKWNFVVGLWNCVWNCNFKMDLLDFDCLNLFVKKNFPQWYFLGLILLLLFKLSDIWMLVEFHSEVVFEIVIFNSACLILIAQTSFYSTFPLCPPLFVLYFLQQKFIHTSFSLLASKALKQKNICKAHIKEREISLRAASIVRPTTTFRRHPTTIIPRTTIVKVFSYKQIFWH